MGGEALQLSYKIGLGDDLNRAPAAMSPPDEWYRTPLANAEQVHDVNKGRMTPVVPTSAAVREF